MASAEARARPILGEVCAQIADVQVRNRGTIGGNLCSNDPTNHLPPLMVAIGARMTIAGRTASGRSRPTSSSSASTSPPSGPGELLTQDHGARRQAGRLRGGHARGRRHLHRQRRGEPRRRRARRDRLRRRRARAAEPESADDETPCARRSAAPASMPPFDVHASSEYRTHLAEVLAVRAVAQAPRERASDRGTRLDVSSRGDRRHDQRRRVYEREVEARKLLIHFIRDDLDLTGSHIGCDTGNCGACSVIVDGTLVKSCMMLAVQADGSSIETVEGLADGRRADGAAAGVQRPSRAPVRLLHARDADERDRAAPREPRARARTRSRRRCRATSAAAPATGTSSRPCTPRRGEVSGIDDDRAAESRSRSRRRRRVVGPERAAQGGPAARPGPGRLRRRHQAARHGLHPLRALAVRARAHHVDRRLEGRGR